jgi:starch-binding outer membrane protein, SusD/RagB family
MPRRHLNLEPNRAMKRTHITGGRAGWIVSVALVSVMATACDTGRLLEVTPIDRVGLSLYDDPAQAVLMVNSAQAEYECAFASYVMVEGIISDELADAQLGAAAWPYDRRDANTQPGGSYGVNLCTSNQTPGIYLPLSTARWAGDNALTQLQAWTDAQVGSQRTALIARAALYAGFSYLNLGMSMCEAAFDLGPKVNQAGMFALAEQRFTTAIAAAQTSGQTSIRDAAYVGRARARLFQANNAGAAADAALVPAGFVYDATYAASDLRRFNRVFASVHQNGFYTVDPLSRDLRTEGVIDPRAAVKLLTTQPADAKSTVYGPTKYTGYGSPIRIASYDEARLIMAEVAGGSQAVTIINALRAAAGVPTYTGPTDAAAIKTLIVNERQRALFLEGFRNYDIQRFNLPLVPAPGTPYPLKGGNYGNTTCLPLPDIERFNNPAVGT